MKVGVVVVKEFLKKLQTKKFVLMVIILLISCLSIWGLRNVNAFYNSTNAFSLLGTTIGNFEPGYDSDINIILRIPDPDKPGEYNRIHSIPDSSYSLNEERSGCDRDDAYYTFNSFTNQITVKSPGKTVCNLIFEKGGNKGDVEIITMKESATGTHSYNGKSYESTAFVPNDFSYNNYQCENPDVTTVEYDTSTKYLTFVSSQTNKCYVYFDASNARGLNHSIYTFIETSKGSGKYKNVLVIPSGISYKLSSVKQSYCSNGGVVNYVDGVINIDASSNGDCYVYLDEN